MWVIIDLAEIVGFVVALTKYCLMVSREVGGTDRIEVLIWLIGLAIIWRLKINAVLKKGADRGKLNGNIDEHIGSN